MVLKTFGDATLICGDCREAYETIPPISAVIADPPYGINFRHGKGGHGLSEISRVEESRIIGDDKLFDPSWIFNGLKFKDSSSKKIALFGADHFAKSLPDGEWLCWDKTCGKGGNDSFRDAEFIWSSVKTPRTIFRHLWKGLCRHGEEHSSKSKRLHVSQKPVALMIWLIESMRVGLGDLIFDPYMGSGTTGIAAIRTGRKFIGCEIDPAHFETACKRIENEALSLSENLQLGN